MSNLRLWLLHQMEDGMPCLHAMGLLSGPHGLKHDHCCMQSAEKDSSNLQKEVDKAADHVTKLTERVRKAEAGQIEAQNKLAAAGVETSSARKLVEAVSLLLLPTLYSMQPAIGRHQAIFSIHSMNRVFADLPRLTRIVSAVNA